MRCKALFVAAAFGAGLTAADAMAVTAASPGANPFPAAGVLASDIFNNGSGNNNGTLIASQYVLTAAHVASGFTAPFTFTVGGNTYNVDQVTIHPSYNGDVLSGNDIAIAHLTTPVTNVTPAQLFTGTTELTQTFTLVGNGRTGTGATGGTTYPGTILSANNVYDLAGAVVGTPGGPRTVPASVLFFDFDDGTAGNNKSGILTPTTGEGMTSANDSGGGSFITIGPNTFLAGVHSFGLYADGVNPGKFGDVGADTRVSSHLAFINSVVPEPASVGVILLAGVGLLAQRRRA